MLHYFTFLNLFVPSSILRTPSDGLLPTHGAYVISLYKGTKDTSLPTTYVQTTKLQKVVSILLQTFEFDSTNIISSEGDWLTRYSTISHPSRSLLWTTSSPALT